MKFGSICRVSAVSRYSGNLVSRLVKLDDSSAMTREFWQKVMSVRTAISKELEKSRGKGDIGSS